MGRVAFPLNEEAVLSSVIQTLVLSTSYENILCYNIEPLDTVTKWLDIYIVGESLVTAQVELRNTASLMSRYCNIATISRGQKYFNCVTLLI